jgi:hypothetical protein
MFYNTSNIKERGRKRKQRDFYGDFAKPKVPKVPEVRALLDNSKDMINQYVRAVSEGHVFTLEDPDKWRTTDTLEGGGLRVTAVSTNPKILDRDQVHAYSTQYLQRVDISCDKPSVCWLDYCGSVRRSNPHFDWLMDLEVCLDWMVESGMVLLTFAKRGVPNYMSFVFQQIATLSGAQVVDVYEYQGEHGAAMCVFTVVKKIIPRKLLSVYMTPQEGQTVRVKDHTGEWTGVVCKQYTPNEFEVRSGEERCNVFRNEITHIVV